MAKNRKSISLSKRYEILERDNFTCQYCGRSAPDVVLEIDHIIPVYSGGDNSKCNLVTACRECNNGKQTIRLNYEESFINRNKNLLAKEVIETDGVDVLKYLLNRHVDKLIPDDKRGDQSYCNIVRTYVYLIEFGLTEEYL